MKPAAAAIIILLCPPAYAAGGEAQEFMDTATKRIERYIAVPCETPQTAEIKVQLESFPNGYLKSIEVVQSSGYPPYDKAVLRAIADAQPFAAADPETLKKLDSSILYFKPGIPAYDCNLQPLNGEIPNLKVNELPSTPPKAKSK